MSNNLGLTREAEAQNNPHIPQNDCAGEIDALISETTAIGVTNTNSYTLTDDELDSAVRFTIGNGGTSASAAFTINLPASSKRGLTFWRNTLSYTATIQKTGGQSETAPTVAAGEHALIDYDGTNARLISAGTSGGGVSIPDGSITLAKLANIANNRVLGNVSGGAAAPSALTASDLSTLLSLGTAAALASDTDTGLTANSDLRIATQKAVKAYVDQIISAQDAMVFKGATDCSANPNYPAADAGHTYRVANAGKIGGASGVVVEVGDFFICLGDGTASGNQAAVGANWTVFQSNLDGAVIGPASVTDGRFAAFDGTTGKLIKELTAAQATAALNALVGDSGSGGTKGLVPAPASGDAAASKYLKADGTWDVPAGGVGGSGASLGKVVAFSQGIPVY